MTPAQLSLAARDAVALRLPSVLRQDGQDRARDLAAQLRPLLEDGKQIPADLLAKLEADKDNPWFAKTLLETLGPQAPDWAMLVMEANGFPPDYNQRVITDFGQLLALSTRQTGDARLSDSYVQEFLAPLDEHNGIGLDYAYTWATCCTSAARSAPVSCSSPATSSTRSTRRARTARCTRWSPAGCTGR
jgi:hypothetical protein